MGLKYLAEFDSDKGLECRLEIHAEGYSGSVIPIILTEQAVNQNWPTDEPKPAVRGCELSISILNEDESLPIRDFISEVDNFFKVVYEVEGDVKFEGYLVQDDFEEILVDYPHEINLKATDNLALLKDVSLGDAAVDFGNIVPLAVTLEQTDTNKIRLTGIVTHSTGLIVEIDTGTALDGRYQTKTFQYDPVGGLWTDVWFETDLNGTVVGSMAATYTQYQAIDLTQRMLLSDVLGLCLKATDLPLNIRVYGSIYPEGADDSRLFDNTYITPESFLSGETWSSCYDVITKIIGRLGFTLFQSEGDWIFIRFDDLKRHANAIPGKSYNSDFEYTGMMSLNNEFTTGFDEDIYPEEGLSHTFVRSLKFDRETFNYRNPENIIKNIDFTELGELVDTDTVGADTLYKYRMAGWNVGFEWNTGGTTYVSSNAERLIYVLIDPDGNEKERYGVILGNSGFDDYACAQSNGVEVRAGDRVKYSFDYKTNVSQPGNVNNYFRVNLLTTLNPVPRSSNNRYLASDGKWNETGPIILNNVPAGDNTNEWHSVSVESEPIPTTGLIFVKLAQSVGGSSSTKETHYKNLRFEVIRQAGGSQKVIGHEHTSKQLLNIKNTQEDEIFVDVSPSNAIAGTLMLHTFTGPVRDLVTTWNNNGDTYRNLGHITTEDELYYRKVTRLKLEGTLWTLLQEGRLLSPLAILSYAQFTDKWFVFGKMSIDWRHDKVNCTMYELYEEGEPDLVEIYGFKYLYEKA